MNLTRESLLQRKKDAAERVNYLEKYPKLGAMAAAQEDLALCDMALRYIETKNEKD